VALAGLERIVHDIDPAAGEDEPEAARRKGARDDD
jgi:hypothetical protein